METSAALILLGFLFVVFSAGTVWIHTGNLKAAFIVTALSLMNFVVMITTFRLMR